MTGEVPGPPIAAGPLAGITVVELASTHGALAGRLLADYGAEVILVEPPGGHPSRRYEPFAGDHPDPESSLWWWHFHTNKSGVTLDPAAEPEVFRALVRRADVVLEGEPPGRLAGLGLDYPDLAAAHPGLVWASLTPYGRETPAPLGMLDLTLQAGGGQMWSSGYDDHALPPVRIGGDQGYQTGSLWAVMGVLTAVFSRLRTGRGQLVDVSFHAAANVTTEHATVEWHIRGATVQRQTNRHAGVVPTQPCTARTRDGKLVHTGVPPRTPKEYQNLLDWLDDLGLREEFDEAFFLEMGARREHIDLAQLGVDPELTAIYGAAREVVSFLAERMDAYEFFVSGQRHGQPCAVVSSPEEVITDPHLVARGFPVALFHDELGREVVYPGAPFSSRESPWRLRSRAPRLGEHNEAVLGPLHPAGGAR